MNDMVTDLVSKIDDSIKKYELNFVSYKPLEKEILNRIPYFDYYLKNPDSTNLIDLITASVIINDKYDDLEKVLDFSQNLKKNINECSIDKIMIWLNQIFEGNKDKINEGLIKIFSKNESITQQEKNDSILNINKFFNLILLSTEDDVYLICNLIKAINYIYNVESSLDASSLSIREKVLILSPDSISFFDRINKIREEINNHNKKIKKENTYNISSLNKLKREILKSIKQDEITNIDLMLEYSNNELKDDVISYITYKNMKYYEILEQQYNDLRKNSISNFVNIFGENNIDFYCYSEKEQKEIIKYGYDYIEYLFKFLNKINFSFDKSVIFVIRFSNKKIIEEIDRYLQIGYMNSKYINENIDILNINNYEKMICNMKIVLDNGLNIKDLDFDGMEFYTADSNIIKKNINILSKMSINIKTRILKNYNFLCKENLKEYILELLNLNIDINSNINILNCDYNIVKRIKICNNINVDIYEDKKIKDYVYDKDLFFIPDSKLDEYIYDKSLVLN